jgi:DNA adenine methylase
MVKNIQKPFLKWVGGKTQLINQVTGKFPNKINNYHEIFLGGGSVLFALLSLQKEEKIEIKGKIYAYDLNESLINIYKNIQSNSEELFEYMEKYWKEYDEITGSEVNRKPKTKEDSKTSKESYYYWVRSLFNSMNKSLVERSAIFIFLNKTCFRGLYREGPNGFNVPYGHYKKTPSMITKDELNSISELIQEVHFECCDFGESINKVNKGDTMYLDPPYAPENSKSFVGYTTDGFSIETHNKLFKKIIEKDKSGIAFILSNSKVEMVINYFKDYNTEDVLARRAINSKNPESKTTEVIIHN